MKPPRRKSSRSQPESQTGNISRRDFYAHVLQYIHYVEDTLMSHKALTPAEWSNSVLRNKGVQIKEMMEQ
jgi:hypothetical protein